MRMCYVGKATKIFIFIVIALVATGLLLGFKLSHHVTHNSVKSPAQTNEPNYPLPDTSTPVTPPPPIVVQEAPQTPDTSSNFSPPLPPPLQDLVSPPPPLQDLALPPPPPPLQDFVPPPTPVVVVTMAPPPVFSPPSPVGTPGPVQAFKD